MRFNEYVDNKTEIEGDRELQRAQTLTLCAPVFSHDAPYGTNDLLSDGRGHGRGVYCTVRMTTQVVHQLLQNVGQYCTVGKSD